MFKPSKVGIFHILLTIKSTVCQDLVLITDSLYVSVWIYIGNAIFQSTKIQTLCKFVWVTLTPLILTHSLKIIVAWLVGV